MTNYVDNKVVVITGAAGGFGRLTVEKLIELGGRVLATDINEKGLNDMAESIQSDNLKTMVVDASSNDAMKAMVAYAVETFGSIDVLVNNAGIMPLAWLEDHKKAMPDWEKCIDLNIKGILYGITAVYDQMIAQGRGQIINLSSIYGNAPVEGGTPYGMTKNAVGFMTDALRNETKGKIKMTTIRPTFCQTALMNSVVNFTATQGLLANKFDANSEVGKLKETDPRYADPDNILYNLLDPSYIADNIVYVINQPWGISISDMTIRASGDYFTE